jgi:hypothetical protein
MKTGMLVREDSGNLPQFDRSQSGGDTTNDNRLAAQDREDKKHRQTLLAIMVLKLAGATACQIFSVQH